MATMIHNMTKVTPQRERNPRGEGDRLRGDLIRAALDQLATSGDRDSVSLRSVAKAAGVSPTATYRHFDDRDSLIDAACEECFEEFSTYMLEGTLVVEDPFERLRAAGLTYVRYAAEHAGHYRILFSNPASRHDYEFDTVADPGGTAFQQLISLVEGCVAAGARPTTSDDPVYLAFQVWTWIHGIVDLQLSHPHLPWPDAERMIDDLARALGLHAPG